MDEEIISWGVLRRAVVSVVAGLLQDNGVHWVLLFSAL